MIIAIGSANPVKIEAAQDVLSCALPAFTLKSIFVPSGVSDMPASDQECIDGARNRATAARNALGADWGVGIEGGVQQTPIGLVLTAWSVVINQEGKEGVGGGGRLPLPRQIAERIKQGEELGPVMDQLTNRQNVKQMGGAVGILTNGLVERKEALAVAVAYALAPFVAPNFYPV